MRSRSFLRSRRLWSADPVPEVLEWQSLRKCSFAAPFFHDPSMPVPDINEQGLPLTVEEETLATDEVTGSGEAEQVEPDPNQEFEIERIVSAVKAGRGWTLQVKWAGYPDTTPEPLWRILRQTNHPDILQDIERCKADYYLQHRNHEQEDELNGEC